MPQRGNCIFWTLFVLVLFVLFNVLFVPRERFSELPVEIEYCLKECLFEYEPATLEAKSSKNENINLEKSSAFASSRTNYEYIKGKRTSLQRDPWWKCPEPGLGPASTFLTAFVDGRLGNVVWSYLSILVGAKIHGLRPVLNKSSNDFLYNIFNESLLRIPTLEDLDLKCSTSYLTETYAEGHLQVDSKKAFYEFLEDPPKEGFKMLKFSFYVTNTEELIPFWHELKDEITLKEEFTNDAASELRKLKFLQNQYLDKLENENVLNRDFEFVGVHVRRTDYAHHMTIVHPGSDIADERFYLKAMDWIAGKVEKKLIFVVVSDDATWVMENLVSLRADTYLGGTSDVDNPGMDLALLGACNHTIFAYGTFGLTGALLASAPGGFTVIFDPRNGTVTKEMEFAANLPGWRIMDSNGNFNYEDKRIAYEYYLHPRIT